MLTTIRGFLASLCLFAVAAPVSAATTIRIMPPDGGVLAAGQRFDIRVEATADGTEPPRGLTVLVNGKDITSRNILDPGPNGERGSGGRGTSSEALPRKHRAGIAPTNTINFLTRDYSVALPGRLVIEARTADGAKAAVRLTVERWAAPGRGPSAKNLILLLGDGMGMAHRTAARLVSRGLTNGKANGRLAMDTLEATGVVMTAALNSAITDSSPGMSAYATGQKSNNNQEGVFPDNTRDSFDNPRIEYLGEILRRTRGPGFNVGIVTTADLTDSTPAANAVHTSDRMAGTGIAERFFDERASNGVSVLLGGGGRYFLPKGTGRGERTDGRDLASDFAKAGYERLSNGSDVGRLLAAPKPPSKLLGLFHHMHLPVAFDKVGAGKYSSELARSTNEPYRDTPMLEDMARLALRSLSNHSPRGFYLLIEGASIDKRAHAVDAERMIWDVIEFDRAVAVALEFAHRTNSDANPGNDTLVIVTADHETGGLGIIGVGNERYAPATTGTAVRDYAAVFRFTTPQQLTLFPNYQVDAKGFPLHPDPSQKILLGWAAGPDHYENWVSNRIQQEAAIAASGPPTTSVANPARDGTDPASDNKTVDGRSIAGILVQGTIENGATPCPSVTSCPADTASVGHTISGHSASDVPLSASGPGAMQFVGVYENTDVFIKVLKAAAGTYRGARRDY
jgi:alkaline phosphatase